MKININIIKETHKEFLDNKTELVRVRVFKYL